MPRRLPATPRRALLLGSYLQGEARRLIIDTWSSLGVEVVQVGQTHPTLHPEDDISAADIVVGKGRAVLDAMSCGRPAYVYDAYGSDGWMTEDSYADLEADSIAGQAYPGIVDAARLRADLAGTTPPWDTSTGPWCSSTIRRGPTRRSWCGSSVRLLPPAHRA